MSPEVAAARAAAAAAAACRRSAASAPAAPAAKLRPPLKSIGPDTNGGFLLAYDPATGTERWRVPGGSAIGGGTVATGGGIVFQATGGTLYAYSADKGEKLLELKTGIPGGMAPPITFMVDGKQYVALQVGQGRPGPGPGGNAPPPESGRSAPGKPAVAGLCARRHREAAVIHRGKTGKILALLKRTRQNVVQETLDFTRSLDRASKTRRGARSKDFWR